MILLPLPLQYLLLPEVLLLQPVHFILYDLGVSLIDLHLLYKVFIFVLHHLCILLNLFIIGLDEHCIAALDLIDLLLQEPFQFLFMGFAVCIWLVGYCTWRFLLFCERLIIDRVIRLLFLFA